MIRGFRQIALLTTVSRIFGLMRDVAYGHFIVPEILDAWIIAFRIPNLSRRLFGEGAASASFIPVYSEQLHRDRRRAAALANTVVTVLFVILALLVLLGEAGIWFYYKFSAPNEDTVLILSLSSIMLPYMLFICTLAILAGILNVHKHFAAPAAAPIVLNIFIIGTLLLTGWCLKLPDREQLFYIAGAVLIAGLAQIAIQIRPMIRAGIQIRPAWHVHSESFRRILLLMGPMILGLTVTQINTLSDDLIAWWFSGSEQKGQFLEFFGRQVAYPMWRGSVSHLYFAQRLYQLPLGVLGISLATAVFPVMSVAAARNDLVALTGTIRKGLGATVFVAIPATVGLIIVAGPLIAAAFQHGAFSQQDTKMVVHTLTFYSLGLCGYFSQQILARAFYSMKDSVTPMRSALVAVFANFCLNLILIWPLGRSGLACATAICSYLQVSILVWVLYKRLGREIVTGLGGIFVKSLIGTVALWAAGMAVLLLMRRFPESRSFHIIRLTLIVPACAGVYLLIARLLGNEMLAILKGSKSS